MARKNGNRLHFSDRCFKNNKIIPIGDRMQHNSSREYKTLFENVCQIYETTLLHAEDTYERNKNSAYFRTGQRIDHILESAEQTGHASDGGDITP
jgi:hypothetical protein